MSKGAGILLILFTIAAAVGVSFYVLPIYSDGFDDPGLPGWTVVDGQWQTVSDETSSVLMVAGHEYDRYDVVLDCELPQNYVIEVDVYIESFERRGPEAQVILRYQDPSNYYFVGVGAYGYLAAVGRYVDGTATLVDGGGEPGYMDVETGRWYRVKASVMDSTIKVWVDGQLVVEAVDTSHPEGRAGLTAIYSTAYFDNFAVNRVLG